MNPLRSTAVIAATLLAATFLFWGALHQVSSLWLDVALRPEVAALLERSMDDQKRLRSLDPANAGAYRSRFEETRKLLSAIEVLRINRLALVRRFELALVAAFALAALASAFALWLRQRRAADRERIEYLTRLSALQETARRHAHEIKGPLTAARLELERYSDALRAGCSPEERERIEGSIAEELQRLARYTREIASFGAMAQPVLRAESLGDIAAEFCATFATAWPGVQLHRTGDDATVCADRDMVRQVLVNLCTNSAHAGAKTIRIEVSRDGARAAIDVVDDGSGVPLSLRPRVFDPYFTSRRSGEGMGLGLAISRKVLIDHGGDLSLMSTSSEGTTFRATFGDRTCS